MDMPLEAAGWLEAKENTKIESSISQFGGRPGVSCTMPTIHVKATSGAKISVDVELSSTVVELKETLSASDKANVPSTQQRLIYRGHVMKDDRTLESYGLAVEHTVHLVKSVAPGAAAATPASTPASAPAPAPAAPPANPMGGGFGGMGGDMGSVGSMGSMGGFGGMGGLGGMRGGQDFNAMQQQLQQNPAMMRDMLNSPMMRSAMDEMARNPEMLRQMIQSDPRMREVMEANPELSHALNDPETLRRTFEVAANPSLMAEQMRLTDRAMSNIEAHPEGFNALSRMHSEVGEPLMRAAEGRGDGGGNATSADPNNPFAAMFAANPVGGGTTGNGTSAATPGTPAPSDPWAPNATVTPADTPGGNPFASMFGGGMGAGMGAGMNTRDPDQMLTQMEQMLDNPVMSQMMQQMMSNPQVFQNMIDTDPQLRQMADANPGMREMLQNPEVVRQMTNPETLRSQLQMMRTMQGMGMGGPMGLGSMGMGMRGMGGGAPMGSQSGGVPRQPTRPPEELYASQLQQMKDMGFFDEAQNIRVLTQCMGNVSAAIERLLAAP